MARKPKTVHPSLLGGNPEHGDEWKEDLPLDATNEELDDDDDDGGDPHYATPNREDLLQEQINALKQQNAHLQRMIPPPKSVQNLDEPAEEEPDWENLIFSNPKEAVRLIREGAVKETESKLRGEYQRDQSTSKFWSDFNKAHPDLAEDGDLVDLMLQKHLAAIADLPVREAMDRLADLTRKRIMALSGNGSRPKSRAVVEGASPPSSKKPVAEKSRPVTLSDLIKGRRENRRKAASAA
jgi:hypothetical protein